MKKTKICPKCSGREIYKVTGNIGAYGVGNNLHLGATHHSAIPVSTYVCCSCGYSEQWIDSSDILKVKESRFSRPVN